MPRAVAVVLAVVLLSLLAAGCGGGQTADHPVAASQSVTASPSGDTVHAGILESQIACDHVWIPNAVVGTKKAISATLHECGVSRAEAGDPEAATQDLIDILSNNRAVLDPARVKSEVSTATDELLDGCRSCLELLNRYAATLG
jgi:hypothetical protein